MCESVALEAKKLVSLNRNKKKSTIHVYRDFFSRFGECYLSWKLPFFLFTLYKYAMHTNEPNHELVV